MSLVAAVRAALQPAGLNLVAVAPVERYDGDVPEAVRLRNRHPHAQSVIVIGNGGGEFWSGFRRYCDERPGFCEREPHPLDAYTVALIERAVPPLLADAGIPGRLLYPFRFAEEPVSFMHLGAVAGLGVRSLLGVLVHPEFGPWIALRAALLVDAEIALTSVTSFDPCGTCTDKPCIRACPADAVSEQGWNVPVCTTHRSRFSLPNGEAPCRDRCDARWHCIYGRAHRYPADALAYHQRRALAVMRSLYGA